VVRKWGVVLGTAEKGACGLPASAEYVRALADKLSVAPGVCATKTNDPQQLLGVEV